MSSARSIAPRLSSSEPQTAGAQTAGAQTAEHRSPEPQYVGVEPLAELEALARRLAVDIAAASAAPPERRPRFLVFRAGGRRLWLSIAAVREVVVPPPLSRVPRAPTAVLGIMNLRGRVVAVVDLAQVLPDPPEGRAAERRDERILLLELGGREVGALVEAVEGISSLPPPDGGDESAAAGGRAPQPLDPVGLRTAIETLVE